MSRYFEIPNVGGTENYELLNGSKNPSENALNLMKLL